MKSILELHNIGKKYKIQHLSGGYLSFRDRIADMLSFKKSATEDFWALQDISFEVKPGESLGIIGRNGAGKSTLLKILSKITPPTTGRVLSRGRIASLLEVGTGFHPELTGRENIFFNGSLLGMKHKEIEQRFDEIVDFSGVEKFLDTPLKHYSSGMQLRLAFAVAAHLEPEILIIDEVLAVGDAEFQRKCLRKMEDVAGQGRTILFVSHNLPSLKSICKRGVLLESGKLTVMGDIGDVITAYTNGQTTTKTLLEGITHLRKTERISSLTINNSEESVVLADSDKLDILFDVSFSKRIAFEFQLHIKKEDVVLCSYSHFVKNEVVQYEPGNYSFKYKIDLPDLRSGKYVLDICFAEAHVAWVAHNRNEVELVVLNHRHNTFINNDSYNWWGPSLINGSFKYSKLGQNSALDEG